jgi:ABC-type glycerol-3-phosphate transport system permease component
VTMMIAPLIILAIILDRYIAKGILVGAVKG